MLTQPLVKQAEDFDACAMIDRSINPIFRLFLKQKVLTIGNKRLLNLKQSVKCLSENVKVSTTEISHIRDNLKKERNFLRFQCNETNPDHYSFSYRLEIKHE